LKAQSITGVVKSASGEPVAGATVKVRNDKLGYAFIAVSQAQGRYSTPKVVPGTYTVQAVGGDHQSDGAATVDASSAQPAKMDLVLSMARKIPPPIKKISEADWEKMMPDGQGKTLMAQRCTLCHGMERVVPTRASQEEWQKTVDTMRGYMKERKVPLPDQERDAMVEYLAANYGPKAPRYNPDGGSVPDPTRNLPGNLLQGAEAKYVAMEFKLAPKAGPHDIAVDSQGIAWVSERTTNSFGRYDLDSMTYSHVTLPAGKFKETGLNAIAVDPKDVVWSMDNGPNARLVQYNVKSREFNIFPIPSPPNSGGSAINTLRFYPDGTVWGTGIVSSQIIKLDTTTRKVTSYPVPVGSHPYGLAIGGDKMLWYLANYGDEVVRLDINTGKLTRYKVPTRFSDLRRMAADVDGNLWAGAHEANHLVKVEYKTGKITEFSPPTANSGPYSVDVDTKRNLVWFSERYADKIGRYDPRTNTFAEFSVPTPDTDIRRIEIDRSHPNRIWWSGSASDRIGYIEVLE
jgi:streptogramin lyase